MAVAWEDLEKENARRRAYRLAHNGRGPGSVIDARAPLADPGDNMGAISNSPLSWANKFKDSRTGITTSQSAAKTLAATDPRSLTEAQNTQVAGLLGRSPAGPTVASAPASISASVLSEIMPLNPFVNIFGAPPAVPRPPSLSVLATGGENHAQRWMGNADRGMSRVAKYSDISKPMRTTYGGPRFEEEKSPFRWASAFR